MKSSLVTLLAATALTVSATASQAETIPLLNASFDDPALAPGTYTVGTGGSTYNVAGGASNIPGSAVTDWTISESNSASGASAGVSSVGTNQVAYASNTQAINVGTLTQLTSISFVAGPTYNLSVLAETITNLDSTAGLGTYTLSLLDNGVVVSHQDLASVDSFTGINLTYKAVDTGKIGVALTYTTLTTDFQLGLFDNVVLTTAAVPEPSTYALMLAGLGVLAFARRASLKRSAV